jgi:transketolase
VTEAELDQLCVNTIRTLSIDAVQAADSGHPGTPMALAPVVYALWQREMRFDPDDPIWPNRDRFVLSCGHASMLLYSMLHLTRTKAVNPKYERLGTPTVALDDIKKFRQLDSKCPGHPEYRWTSGVETTTGPLGQGYATSVGMAIARRWLAARFNRPGFTLFDYNVYALGGDGCMMEGIAAEAASLAGHLGLSELCWIYDNNRITIEGETKLAFSEDVATRFIGYGWNVTRVGDANDLEMLSRAFHTFHATTDRPTLIIVDSHIGYGSRKQDTHSVHGAPLGDDEIKYVKRQYGWPEDAKFLVPDGVYEHFARGMGARSHAARTAWETMLAAYAKEFPALAEDNRRMQRRELPDGWDKDLPSFPADAKGKATRDTSGVVLNALAKQIPWLIGGSADLAPSTKTRLTFEGAGDFQAGSYGGRNLHFGVREHAISLYSKWIDRAGELGSPTVRCDPGTINLADLSPTIASYKTLVAHARSRNIDLIVENHGTASAHPEELAAILKSSGAGALPDFGNFPDAETRERGLKLMFPMAKGVCHAKLNPARFEIARCVEIAKQAKFAGVYSIEAGGRGDPYESVQQVVDALLGGL